jgi:uracil-DNA glycosylase
MTDTLAAVRAYLNQQIELGMPDLLFPPGSGASSFVAGLAGPSSRPAQIAPVRLAAAAPAVAAQPAATPKLLPVSRLAKTAGAKPPRDENDPVRRALVELYNAEKECRACSLGATRKKFVFGSGSVHAPVMVIGEAPGADEDEQGLPFVGAAGEMLTKMLAAIGLDRAKDVFITNVLKCRPPANRTPESTEIDACGRILSAQIKVIRPKVFLLLGRIAAHALLQSAESIAALRSARHEVGGVPAFVTYHPAALLHNTDNKIPAWEDLKKFRAFLTERGIHAASN